MTDAELVARAKQGDHSAFGTLIDRHRTAVLRAAMAVLSSAAEADDTAQDAFILAYRRLDSFRGEASFKTWLLTIAWNQAINRRRRLSRWWARNRSLDSEPVNTGEDVASVVATPERAVIDADLRNAVLQEVRALTPILRDVLLLVQSGEYTYEEIAAVTAAPVGTVKWRISEARRLVRKRLRERGYVYG